MKGKGKQAMTNYEFFKAIATNAITEEVIAKAQAYVDKEDAAKAEKVAAQIAFDEVVLEALAEATAPVTSTELAKSIEDEDYSAGKVNKSCQRLVASGKVTKIDGKPALYKVTKQPTPPSRANRRSRRFFLFVLNYLTI